MKLQTIAVGAENLTVHYYRAGKGQPLLYLHHFLGMVDFEPALAKLAEHFDVIAPYAPGWGPAKDDLVRMNVGPLDITLHQQDVLDALQLDSVHVVGRRHRCVDGGGTRGHRAGACTQAGAGQSGRHVAGEHGRRRSLRAEPGRALGSAVLRGRPIVASCCSKGATR
jgi:hypothetical protein